MAVKTRVVTVGTTAVRLDAALSDNDQGSGIAVHNDGATLAYLGGPDVTADADEDTGGYKLAAGQHYASDDGRSDHLYARVASGSTTIRVIQVSA